MKLCRRRLLHLAAGAAALPPVSLIAWAQAYPTRPVRIIISQAAGSASDIFARLIGHRLSERLGQQFVIEPRPGAAGNIALEAVVRAPLTATRSCWSVISMRSMRHSVTNSISI
jgi:tripartite-type tricarboxylate transporter receptor subunit TctC